MKPGDLVTTGKYGGDVAILSTSLMGSPRRGEYAGSFRRGEIALVVARDGQDVCILCPEGVGWVWHGNLSPAEGT